MTTTRTARNAPNLPSSSRLIRHIRMRLLWSLALIAIMGSIFVRVRHATANATPQVDMDEAGGVLEKRLAGVPSQRVEAETLRYAQDANPAIRYAAVDSLMKLRSPAAVNAVEQAFTDSNSEVRKRALEDLIGMDKPRGLRLLLAGLRDEDTWIREDAAVQLNTRAGRPNSGVDKQAVPMLMRAITDPNEAVSSSAIHALNKLTGNSWHYSTLDAEAKRRPIVAHWQQWWQGEQGKWPMSAPLADVAAQVPTRSDPAPTFDVDDLAGKPFRSDDLKGKITLLNFWGTWCSACKREIPDLVRIDKTYRTRNVAVVGLTVGDKSREVVQTWCRANGVEYRQALSTEEARQAFGGMEEVPVSLLIDAQGRVRYRWEGDRDFGTFQAAIERLLRESQ